MATYRDYALAEYQSRRAAEEAQAAEDRAALVTAAQQALVPLFTNSTAKVVADPTKVTTPALVDGENGLVVLTVTDGSDLAFGVYPDLPAVYLTSNVDGEWQRGPTVRDLDDVGEYLAAGD